MEWWQILLIILVAVVVGIIGGALVNYVIERIVKKSATTSLVEDLFGKVKGQFVKEREASSAVKQQVKFTAAEDLLGEVKNNHKIATEPVADKLLSFQTQVWDARQYEFDRLPGNLREELTQIYLDIRLANSIVWLSTELGRRSHSLDENYIKLRTTIAERLDRIKPLIERLGE